MKNNVTPFRLPAPSPFDAFYLPLRLTTLWWEAWVVTFTSFRPHVAVVVKIEDFRKTPKP